MDVNCCKYIFSCFMRFLAKLSGIDIYLRIASIRKTDILGKQKQINTP